MKQRSPAFPAETLQHLGLLIALVLLVTAGGFASARPVLASVLVFIFCLPYLAASVATRRASFLYGTMLLGAVAYFLACHALGAPGASFPLLSVALVVSLWVVGWSLATRVPAELAAYPATVFRAMNITVAVFAAWALVQAAGLMDRPGTMRYVAGLAFLGYAGLYLLHCLTGAPSAYTYAFAFFLTLGGILTVAAGWSAELCWVPATASAAALLALAAGFHRSRGYRWSRHYYFASAGVIFLSLVLSLSRWPFLMVNLAAGSLLLWAAYGWLTLAVDGALQARMAERVVAKCLYYGALALPVPVAPMLLILPGNLYAAFAGLTCAVTFSWMAWARRDQVGGRNVHVLAAVMFASAALPGLGRQLPAWLAPGWSLVAALLVLAALGPLRRVFQKPEESIGRRRLAQAAVFPALFAWFIPLLGGDWAVAAAGAAASAGVVAVLALSLKEKAYCHAAGPSLAGAFVASVLLSVGQGTGAWACCVIAAAAAGACFVWADARGKQVVRGAANLCWLILSAAAIVIAGALGAAHALYAVTAVGLVAVLIAGRPRRPRRGGPDVCELFAQGGAALATVAALALGPVSGLGPTAAGLCLLVLSAGYWLSWAFGRGRGAARVACGLLALAGLLVIFGTLSAVEARMVAGAGLVFVLLAFGAAARGRFAKAARSALLAGHLTGIVLACAALIQAWPSSGSLAWLAAAPLVLIYAFMPAVRTTAAGRIGAVLWASFAALLGLARSAGTPYQQQVHLAALLALLWLAAGQLLRRTKANAWSMPLYLSAATLAGFCGIVRLLAPAAEGSWPIFLIGGVVFAALFLILRQDVFAYLVTLSVALMAYDWVKSSTSIFTQDVLFYLVIGAIVLATVFLLPYLRRLLGRTGTLPVFSIFTRRGVVLLSGLIVLITLALLGAYTLKLTGHPKFCLSCHNMANYYTSWQHSAHRNVACIQCHYEPGVTSAIAGKLEGLVQVVKYVSHSYGSKPAAMISNRSCMRDGCHVGMDSSKQTFPFQSLVRFRHDRHLGGRPRGKQLNCVTCHGQTVEGRHISVTETTCLTCHFYGRGRAPVAAGQCLTCHQVPEKTVTFMGQDFDHRKFIKGNEAVRCSHCHSRVTQGDGAVSPTRCRSCHLRQTAEITDQERFHLVHVSKGHFDCLQCHDEIRHGTAPMQQQLLASGNCGNCHSGERHCLQERIYAGTAVAEMEAMPDAMYKAGVACDGCHTDVQVAGPGAMPFTKKRSGARQCADCHGRARYGRMLATWQQGTKDRIAEIGPALEELEKACRSSRAPAGQLARARRLLASARTKLEYVVRDGSFGAHNFPYVSEMLDAAEDEIDSCRPLVAGPKAAKRDQGAE